MLSITVVKTCIELQLLVPEIIKYENIVTEENVSDFKGNMTEVAELAGLYDLEPPIRINITEATIQKTDLEVIRAIT